MLIFKFNNNTKRATILKIPTFTTIWCYIKKIYIRDYNFYHRTMTRKIFSNSKKQYFKASNTVAKGKSAGSN